MNIETAEPITNTMLKEGDKVAIIGMVAQDPFRTEKGIEILGPRHFGFNIKYMSIEKQVLSSS